MKSIYLKCDWPNDGWLIDLLQAAGYLVFTWKTLSYVIFYLNVPDDKYEAVLAAALKAYKAVEVLAEPVPTRDAQ